MSTSRITALRQSGELSEAYQYATKWMETLRANEDDDSYAIQAFLWVLYDQLKGIDPQQDFQTYLAKAKEILNHRISSDEEIYWNALLCHIRKALKSFSASNNTSHFKILAESLDLAHTPPCLGKSLVTREVHKMYKGDISYGRMMVLINALQGYRDDDYQKFQKDDGKKIISLVEQIICAYSKWALTPQPIDGNPFNTQIDLDKIQDWIPKLDALMSKAGDMEYPLYFKGKLLKAIGERDSAMKCLLTFLKSNANKSWAWSNFGDLYQSNNKKKKECYARALGCSDPDKIIIGIRKKLAELHYSDAEWGHAKYQLEKIQEISVANGYNIPTKFQAMIASEEISNAIIPDDLSSYYNQLYESADLLLFRDIPSELAIVTGINREKGIAHYMISKEVEGSFQLRNFTAKLSIGDTLSIKRQISKRGDKRVVQCASSTESHPDSKIISGEIEISKDRNFGFVNNIFCPASLLPEPGRYTITAMVIPSFDTKKDVWGEKVLTILTYEKQ